MVVGKSMLSSLRTQPHRGVSRPVDILYLGVLTAEHFPLQLELPDIGDKRRVEREREREIAERKKTIGKRDSGRHHGQISKSDNRQVHRKFLCS